MAELLGPARLGALVLHGAGWMVVYTLVAGLVVGSGLMLLLVLLRRRAAWARYALCCGALVLLAGVPIRTAVAVRDSYGGHNRLANDLSVTLMREGSPVGSGSLAGGWSPEALTRAVEARHNGMQSMWISGPAALGLGSVLAALGLGWIIGASWRLGRFASAWRAAYRLESRDTTPASARWSAGLDRVRQRLGVERPLALRISPHVDGPVLIGWWRPVILVPPTPHLELSDREVEAVLAHEVAHVRRGDFAVNLVQSVVEAALFFDPTVRWVGMRLREEREYCSDDLACRALDGSIGDYLRALLSLESLRAPARDLAVAASGGPLMRRVRRLGEGRGRETGPRVDVDVLLVVGALVALWTPTLQFADHADIAAGALMAHELRLPRDFERLARERLGPAVRVESTGAHTEATGAHSAAARAQAEATGAHSEHGGTP